MDNFIDSMNIISDTDNIKCSICSLDIPTSSMIQHSSNHFSNNGHSADICLFCNQSMHTSNIENVLEHMIYFHEMKSDCPLCKSEFNEMDNLYYHLQKSIKFVHHCCDQDCTFKTDKKRELSKHKKQKKHKKKLQFNETVFRCKYGKVELSYSEEIDLSFPVEIKHLQSDYNEDRNYDICEVDRILLNTKQKPSISVENHQLPLPLNSSTRLKRKSKIFDPSPEPMKKFRLFHNPDNKKLNNSNFNITSSNNLKSHIFTYSQKVFEKFVAVSNPPLTEDFKSKLAALHLYPMLIIIDEKGKNYICDYCKYESRHSHTDIKRHVFRNHCGISNKNIRIIMKISRCDSEMKLLSDRELIQSFNYDIQMNNLQANRLISFSDNENISEIESTPKKIFKSRIRITKGEMIKIINESPLAKATELEKTFYHFSVSERVLRKYLVVSNPKLTENFTEKLKDLSNFKMSICTRNNVKNYMCETCEYLSVHSHTDIKRHIFRNHCDVSNLNMPAIMKVSRNNSNMQLLSDSELINIINNEISMKKINAHELLTDSDDESIYDCSINRVEKSFKKSNLILLNRKVFNYSVNILKALCYKENCLESFDSLKEKMDVFSTCGVEIYNRNNSQIYMCMNCNWYSKFNIDDVLKHALCFHANFENASKLIKKIIETSHKMNKDFCLLSDDEISRKGWKGRPILD